MTGVIMANNIEDNYLPNPDMNEIVRDHIVILSGCSGGGKSSVLSELARRGYEIIEEPGRQIVKEQLAIGGDSLPWENMANFLKLALSRYLYQFNAKQASGKFIFADRGIVDALFLGNNGLPGYFDRAARKFRYNKKVFLFPPWKEIFKNDQERKKSFEEAVLEYDILIENYKRYGYEIILLPKKSVDERVDFIIKSLP